MKAHGSARGRKQTAATSDSSSPFLTVNEIAVLLRVSVRTLQKLMRRGLPYYAPVPHRRLFLQTEIEAWMKKNSRFEAEATLNTESANARPSQGRKPDPLSGEPGTPTSADQPPDKP
jgi:excisionase family DNA binding protein